MKKLNKRSTVQFVIDGLTEQILEGKLRPGDQLPPELALAEEFDVSRGTVREAIKTLVYLGAVTIQRGNGTFVSSGFSPQLLNPMLYGIILGHTAASNQELRELREILEVGATQLAARHRTEEELEELDRAQENFRRICRTSRDAEEVILADNAFHEVIMRMGHNSLAAEMNKVLLRLIHAWRVESAAVYMQDGRILEAAEYHDQIRDLIARQDAAAAPALIPQTFMWEDEI
ncbi:MAG: FadR family transcriptional regulator [Oscillospiraceae bacterium]|nr:FadR family transcriptional regulator [Oscillospiraceae bacterium]